MDIFLGWPHTALSMSERIPRREALRRLAMFSAAAAAPAWLAGCSKKQLTCTDVTGLTPDDVTMRNTTAAYVDQTPDAAKRCSGCVQYVPAAPDACGGCKVVKGPIHPDGWCKLYVPKPI
jgi:High potential iron-sulfur protein